LSSNKISNQSGFSLAEIVVAFGVLTLGMLAISGSFPFGLKINRESENVSSTTYAAQQKMEQLMALQYSELATGTVEAKHKITTATTSDFYNQSRETIISLVDINQNATTTDVGLKKITINVYHVDAIGRSEKKFTLTSLISRRQ